MTSDDLADSRPCAVIRRMAEGPESDRLAALLTRTTVQSPTSAMIPSRSQKFLRNPKEGR